MHARFKLIRFKGWGSKCTRSRLRCALAAAAPTGAGPSHDEPADPAVDAVPGQQQQQRHRRQQQRGRRRGAPARGDLGGAPVQRTDRNQQGGRRTEINKVVIDDVVAIPSGLAKDLGGFSFFI